MTRLADVRSQLELVRGERVVIRLKHRDDGPADFAWARDPELARLNNRDVVSASYVQFLEQLETDIRFYNPRQRMFALDSTGGDHIGNIMCYNPSSGGEAAEFGITIGAPEYRGRGYGSEATVLFLRYLWETTPLRVVTLHALASNEPALRCFRRSGFENDETLTSGAATLVRLIARREWWLLHDSRGRFALTGAMPSARQASPDQR